MKTLSLFLVIMLSIQASFGYEVKHLEKGETAPFEGYLFTPQAEKELRLLNVNYEYQVELNHSLDKMVKGYDAQSTIMQQRIDNLQDNNSELTKQLSSQDNFFSKVGMFLLGAGLASFVAFGAARAVR